MAIGSKPDAQNQKQILLTKQSHFNILHKMIRKRKITVRGQNNFNNFYLLYRRYVLFSHKRDICSFLNYRVSHTSPQNPSRESPYTIHEQV